MPMDVGLLSVAVTVTILSACIELQAIVFPTSPNVAKSAPVASTVTSAGANVDPGIPVIVILAGGAWCKPGAGHADIYTEDFKGICAYANVECRRRLAHKIVTDSGWATNQPA